MKQSITIHSIMPPEGITITGLLIWTSWLVTMASMGGIQNKVNRRQFIGQCAHTVGSMSILGLLLGSYSKQSVSTPAWAIRPPGAIAPTAAAASTYAMTVYSNFPRGLVNRA